MRLLDVETGQFVEKDPERTVYAILSHTWDTENGEQTYKELKKIQRRYGTRSHVPQSRPGPEGSSLEQDRGGPPPTRPPSQLPRDPSVATLTATSSGLFIPRIQLAGTHASSQPPADAPASDDPPVPASSGPSALSPALQSKPPPQSIWDDPELSPKIREACAVARAHGYRYIWIDSCCIDKSSSSELSEAINSMYAWYAIAGVCYAYLADVPPGDDHEAQGSRFRKSWWFTRGWTLQELIAPVNVVFLSEDWAPIGSKHALGSLVESVTKIDYQALLHLEPLHKFSVAQRLLWAANRKTTRKEDRAYSLLGIFDIHMPTLYGEGDRAFRRLQEQIMQRIPDQSLFAWGAVYLGSQLPQDPDLTDVPTIFRATQWEPRRSPIAELPDAFWRSGTICTSESGWHDTIRNVQLPASHRYEIEYTSTPYGIRTQFQMIPLTRDSLFQGEILPYDSKVEFDPPEDCRWYLVILGCDHVERPGQLLGRVCYTPPSKSGVEFVYTGRLKILSRSGTWAVHQDLFPLSPSTIEYCHPRTELKTVYISHPDHTDLPSILRQQPYVTIKLALLRVNCHSLRYQGYSADLRDPDPDHPTTHWLTLSKDEHTITVEFQHKLTDGGRSFIITAEVKMSGESRVQLDFATRDSDHTGLDRHTVYWADGCDTSSGWNTTRGCHFQKVGFGLSAAGAGTLTLGLEPVFAGTGVYILHVTTAML